ncbi:hypothetical protein KC19_10G012800 [Ceratodon purpureus]|uniref:Uncharacterized protein n=1 Tax=Ceratodon purpureus TaxID=3225 RepID=A0A8T0GKG6_CERPU|nr:hypothetical protein KC19_10G012800 [Ceratodon purpureus]
MEALGRAQTQTQRKRKRKRERDNVLSRNSPQLECRLCFVVSLFSPIVPFCGASSPGGGAVSLAIAAPSTSTSRVSARAAAAASSSLCRHLCNRGRDSFLVCVFPGARVWGYEERGGEGTGGGGGDSCAGFWRGEDAERAGVLVWVEGGVGD